MQESDLSGQILLRPRGTPGRSAAHRQQDSHMQEEGEGRQQQHGRMLVPSRGNAGHSALNPSQQQQDRQGSEGRSTCRPSGGQSCTNKPPQ